MREAKSFFKQTARSFPGGAKKMKRMIMLQIGCTVLLLLIWVWIFGGLIPTFVWGYVDKYVEVHGGDQSLYHFYPDLNDDGSGLRWSHSLNNKDRLLEAMKTDCHILEADVMLEGQNTERQRMIPIMAHPPATTSELTFRRWLYIARAGSKAIMLDFKTIEPVELVLQDLNKITFNRPVWLGADIVPGPAGHPFVVDPRRFLRLCSEHYPAATLVLGWTTNPDPDGIGNKCEKQGYSWQHVYEMTNHLQQYKIHQPIVMHMRGPCIRHSMMQNRWMVEALNSSLLVWAGMKDYVQAGDVMFLKAWIKPKYIYYDFPHWLKTHISETVNHTSNPGTLIDGNLRKLLHLGDKKTTKDPRVHNWVKMGIPGHALPGNRSVMFLSPNALTVSRDTVTMDTTKGVLIEALVYVLGGKSEKPGGFEIQLCPNIKGCRLDSPSAMTFSFAEAGEVVMTGEHLRGSVVDKRVKMKNTNMEHCYKMRVHLSLEAVDFEVRTVRRCGQASKATGPLLASLSGHLLQPDQFAGVPLHVGLRSRGEVGGAVAEEVTFETGQAADREVEEDNTV